MFAKLQTVSMKKMCSVVHIQDVIIVSVARHLELVYCKGVVVRRQRSRPPRILQNVNGKEHHDLGKSEMSNPLPNTIWANQRKFTFAVFFLFVIKDYRLL